MRSTVPFLDIGITDKRTGIWGILKIRIEERVNAASTLTNSNLDRRLDG